MGIWESHQDYSFKSAAEIRKDVINDFMFKTLGSVSPRGVSATLGVCVYISNFGKAIKAALTVSKNVCRFDYTHLVLDAYCELSGERARRAEKAIGIINVMAIPEEIPIPQEIQKFWTSSKNKENIQQLAK